MTFNGNHELLRGGKIIGYSVVKTPQFGGGITESFQIIFTPKGSNKKQIMTIGLKDKELDLNIEADS